MLLVDYDNYNKIYTIVKEREDSFRISLRLIIYKRLIVDNKQIYYLISDGYNRESNNRSNYKIVTLNELVLFYLEIDSFTEIDKEYIKIDNNLIDLSKVGTCKLIKKKITYKTEDYSDEIIYDICELLEYMANKYNLIIELPYIDLQLGMQDNDKRLKEFVEGKTLIDLIEHKYYNVIRNNQYNFLDKLATDNLRDTITIYIGQATTNQKTKYKVDIAKIDYKIERS